MSHNHLQISDLYIVLVESSSMQSKLIVQQLKQLNIQSIKVASTGKQALELIQHDLPDLIISSMYIEDMTGGELIVKIREDELLTDLPFMLISSETNFNALDPVRQAGVVAILPKPFIAKDLKRALLTSLDFINTEIEAEISDESEFINIKALLVDDSTLARKHIRRVLSGLGIEQMDEAINGKDAIPKLESKYYDLIVTDYNMPEMDGHELIKYIRQESSNPSVPILMVTSENDKNRMAGVQQAGVSGICDKPFEPESVKDYLHKIFLDV